MTNTPSSDEILPEDILREGIADIIYERTASEHWAYASQWDRGIYHGVADEIIAVLHSRLEALRKERDEANKKLALLQDLLRDGTIGICGPQLSVDFETFGEAKALLDRLDDLQGALNVYKCA